MNNDNIKKNKKATWLIKLLVTLAATAVAYFAYPIADSYIGRWLYGNGAEEVQEIQILPTQEATPTPTVSLPVETERPTDSPTTAPIEAPTERPLLTDITELRSEFSNDDIVGFLRIEDTDIAYPVAQSSDNDFYLRRDLYGNNSTAGTIFLDYENNLEEFNDNTVIYGHNMRNGTMFHNLRYYRDKQYYESHRYISLTTPYEETTWEVFAFFQTTTDFNYIQTSFKDKDSFFGLILQMKLKSAYDTGVKVDSNDKILTLSTCASEGGDNRYALCAKLMTE